ncbi:coiled-coil domain-containing protein 141-like isoform X2 [Channa argus]|uniref:coiled-coil domain-containing protein 141-like isoform X2 n=1 Tax=Channa argus TaxID=215402 RepID=UPI0035219248
MKRKESVKTEKHEKTGKSIRTETDETVECGRQEVGSIIIRDGGEKEGNKNPSFTTLSTIAIQAGRSQIVISILKSGSLVHLQLVQVHPGLCEIGLSKAENQTLIQEQQQLIEKLKKYEREVLAVVERSRQTEMKKRDEGMMEQKKSIKTKKEEVVNKAMAASLSEGWSLLLHLLERRQEVLTLASDFYNRTQEVRGLQRYENLGYPLILNPLVLGIRQPHKTDHGSSYRK